VIVADTNLLVYLEIPGPATGVTRGVFRKDPNWASTPLWRSEFRNAALGVIRSGQIDSGAATAAFDRVEALLGDRIYSVATPSVFALSVGNRVTAYDLEFVAVAVTLGVPLVTFDKAILAAFPAVAVHPESFLAA
jgi:predicted nucleic acid-binding protein